MKYPLEATGMGRTILGEPQDGPQDARKGHSRMSKGLYTYKWDETGEKTMVAIEETPREKLLRRHSEMCDQARAIMEKKNEDYGADADPFRNFRSFGAFGILVRLSDKLARMRGYIERGDFSVKDETFEDTGIDALNYVILLLAILEFGGECNGGKTSI